MNIEANKGNVTPAGIDTANMQIVQDMLTKTKGYKVSEVTTLYSEIWELGVRGSEKSLSI